VKRSTTLEVLSITGRLARQGTGLALVLTALAASAIAGGPVPGGGVPEIDPGSIAGAATLLTSGVLMLVDRRRK
jgi:hypothetical protein